MSTHGHTKRISPHAQTRGGERRAGCMPGTGYRIRTLQSYKPWFSWWNTQRIYRFRCEQRQPPYPAPFPARYDACQYQNRQCLARFRPSARNDIGASGTRLAATESSVDCSHSRNDQIVAS